MNTLDLFAHLPTVLTSDLLKPDQRGQDHPLAGHCYVASEALYHLLGGKRAGLTPMNACGHWWLQTSRNQIIDATGAQFTSDRLAEIHKQGRGRGFLTLKPSKRAQVVIDRLTALTESC